MSKVEEITTCKPYEKSIAKSKLDIGKCLQEWRLGARFGKDGDVFMCEVNTNRHMFVYLVNGRMIYIRQLQQPTTIMAHCFFRTFV